MKAESKRCVEVHTEVTYWIVAVGVKRELERWSGWSGGAVERWSVWIGRIVGIVRDRESVG